MRWETMVVGFVILLVVLFIFQQQLFREESRKIPELPAFFILTENSATNMQINHRSLGDAHRYDLLNIPISIDYTGTLKENKKLAVVVSFKGVDTRAEIIGGERGKYITIEPENTRISFEAKALNIVSSEPPIKNTGGDYFSDSEELEEGRTVYLSREGERNKINFTVQLAKLKKKILDRFGTCTATFTVECATGKKIEKGMKEMDECEKTGQYRDCIRNLELCGSSIRIQLFDADCNQKKARADIKITKIEGSEEPKISFEVGEKIVVSFWEIKEDPACIDGMSSVDDMKTVCGDRLLGQGTLIGPIID